MIRELKIDPNVHFHGDAQFTNEYQTQLKSLLRDGQLSTGLLLDEVSPDGEVPLAVIGGSASALRKDL